MAEVNHREEVIRLLTKLNERQLTIFKHLKRIDTHLDNLNGQVSQHEKSLIQIKTWGAMSLITLPIIINIIMEII
ncbi:MAG: hypothetical protein Unbinned6224contig1001_45 [Prokaryotic dsDNA virus sp.]|nr:MAG: hypothetical protein Unbinned6224contig1001_45 [Prokaryotic dsDNA virus sp.]|tara:strand:- start:11823 stop:12047 length:225 start_codon:yes stop_codon:yes gene_type:complete